MREMPAKISCWQYVPEICNEEFHLSKYLNVNHENIYYMKLSIDTNYSTLVIAKQQFEMKDKMLITGGG